MRARHRRYGTIEWSQQRARQGWETAFGKRDRGGPGGMRTADRARNAARGALSVACRFSALNYRLTLYLVTPNLGPLFSELANQDEDLLTLGWGSFGARIHRTWCTYNGRYFSGRLKPLPIVPTPTLPFGHCVGLTSGGRYRSSHPAGGAQGSRRPGRRQGRAAARDDPSASHGDGPELRPCRAALVRLRDAPQQADRQKGDLCFANHGPHYRNDRVADRLAV